ncbi:MAG TPA: redox-sensing transcriptional repressor Rex [Candidatus Limnocylindrales bacterium]|nr:redox-sensing transcriptional repressor Rex [Candidatus Limnocylindrales bacterium]
MRRLESTTKLYKIPDASIRRLPIYYHLLHAMLDTGVQTVSTTVIAEALNLDPTQVRKDIEVTGIVGKPKVGYPLETLVRWIEKFLGWHEINEAVLVGAGSLGTALLGYRKFRELGLRVVAAFDADREKVGRPLAGVEVKHLDELAPFCAAKGIRLGVIATPSAAAQEVADRMVAGGIRAIWNFAPVHLRTPVSVIVQNEDLYHSLASLSFRLERMLSAERRNEDTTHG